MEEMGLSSPSSNGDFFSGLNSLADLAGKVVGAVRGQPKPKVTTTAPASDWKKYLPFGIGALVVIVVLALVFRRR